MFLKISTVILKTLLVVAVLMCLADIISSFGALKQPLLSWLFDIKLVFETKERIFEVTYLLEVVPILISLILLGWIKSHRECIRERECMRLLVTVLLGRVQNVIEMINEGISFNFFRCGMSGQNLVDNLLVNSYKKIFDPESEAEAILTTYLNLINRIIEDDKLTDSTKEKLIIALNQGWFSSLYERGVPVFDLFLRLTINIEEAIRGYKKVPGGIRSVPDDSPEVKKSLFIANNLETLLEILYQIKWAPKKDETLKNFITRAEQNLELVCTERQSTFSETERKDFIDKYLLLFNRNFGRQNGWAMPDFVPRQPEKEAEPSSEEIEKNVEIKVEEGK